MILLALHQKYYSSEGGVPQLTDKIVKEAQLDALDSNMLQGDIIYLKNASLIDGEYIIGIRYPYTIQITNYGIDVVQRWIDSFLFFVKQKDNDKFKQLDAMRRGDYPSMMNELYDYLRRNPGLIDNFFESNPSFAF